MKNIRSLLISAAVRKMVAKASVTINKFPAIRNILVMALSKIPWLNSKIGRYLAFYHGIIYDDFVDNNSVPKSIKLMIEINNIMCCDDDTNSVTFLN